jgi:hypothetical protein
MLGRQEGNADGIKSADMKISGLGTIRNTVTRKAGRTGSGSRFQVDGGGETASPQVREVRAPATVGSLLALQEVPDAIDERRRAARRGRDLLRELEQLRVGLLLGVVPRERLERIMRILKERRGEFADPQLDGVIREIEVRAAVELAKFERASLAAG